MIEIENAMLSLHLYLLASDEQMEDLGSDKIMDYVTEKKKNG